MTALQRSRARTVLVWRNDVIAGSETFIRNQVNATRGWRAILMGARRRTSVLSDPNDAILYGDRLVEKVYRRLFLTTGHSRRLDRFVRAQNVGVVHAHFATSASAILPTARRHAIPLVVTIHGFDVTNRAMQSGRRGKQYVRRTQRVFRYATRIIAVSEFIAARAIEDFGADPARVVVLHIGVPSVPQTQVPSLHTSEPSELLFVGRLVEKKGIGDLLDALHLLVADELNPTLTIVGEGPLRESLERKAHALGLAVRFLGHLEPSQVAAAMSASRILVAPSRTAANGDAEGLPTVLLEAARAGVPAIAYRHGGVAEAVVDGVTGLLVPEGDVDGLADALRSLLSDDLRRERLGRAAAERVRRDFDLDSRTQDLVRLYEDVARLSRPGEGDADEI